MTQSNGNHRRRLIGRAIGLVAVGVIVAIGVMLFDGSFGPIADNGGAMVMRPSGNTREVPVRSNDVSDPANPDPTTTTRPATKPAIDDEPVVLQAPSAYIRILDEAGDETIYEFPPAKLWLKPLSPTADGVSRVRVLLFSDDPPEAISQDWASHSFYFEMDLELSQDTALPTGRMTGGSSIAPEDLAYAEWVYRSPSSEKIDTQSGIFLASSDGTARHQLQPSDVFVTFDPIGDGFVDITLRGQFAEFDGESLSEIATRTVRVRAVLTAEAIQR